MSIRFPHLICFSFAFPLTAAIPSHRTSFRRDSRHRLLCSAGWVLDNFISLFVLSLNLFSLGYQWKPQSFKIPAYFDYDFLCLKKKRKTYFILFFICLSICLHVWMCAVYSQFPQRPEGIVSFGIGVADGCETPFRCQELNVGPQQEQQVLLTIETSLPFLVGLLSRQS